MATLQAVQNQLPEDAPVLLAGLGLLFVFDRPLDMCRTAVNIFSDSVGAVTVARSEGETHVLCQQQSNNSDPLASGTISTDA